MITIKPLKFQFDHKRGINLRSVVSKLESVKMGGFTAFIMLGVIRFACGINIIPGRSCGLQAQTIFFAFLKSQK